MKAKDLNELKENFRELGLRTSEILDFKILAKGLDKDGYLNEDFELVDLDKFREIQNTLKAKGLLETGFNNFINITNEIDMIPERLKHNIEKILLGIEQLELFIEKEFLEKQKHDEILEEEHTEVQETREEIVAKLNKIANGDPEEHADGELENQEDTESEKEPEDMRTDEEKEKDALYEQVQNENKA